MASNRTRGIRQPIPGGTVLARIGYGKGPPVPVKITALLQTGGGAAFVRGHQTDNTINGIPVVFTPDPLNNLDLLQYIAADGEFENKSLSQILDGLGAAQGDILYRSATAWTVLAPGTDGNVLTTHGVGANPTWALASAKPEINMFFQGVMEDTELLGEAIFSKTVVFPANFAGSQGKSGGAATLSSDLVIKKNGSNAGTIHFAIGGTTATFTTAGGGTVTFVAGDIITIFGPSPQDVTLTDVVANLVGG